MTDLYSERCSDLTESGGHITAWDEDRWPAIHHPIEITGAKTEEDRNRRDQFLEDLEGLLDSLQKKFCSLPEEERRKCGQNGIAADIAFKVDMQKKEILLDRIYKYCNIENHLFKKLIEILQQSFADFNLVVPALKGYQLAEEIHRHLGNAKIEWIYLKSRTDERLLMGEHLQRIAFEGILEDTIRHYDEQGGIEAVEAQMRPGFEVSMYHCTESGEEEVLWMQVRAPL